jgi:hypothetical protein
VSRFLKGKNKSTKFEDFSWGGGGGGVGGGGVVGGGGGVGAVWIVWCFIFLMKDHFQFSISKIKNYLKIRKNNWNYQFQWMGLLGITDCLSKTKVLLFLIDSI